MPKKDSFPWFEEAENSFVQLKLVVSNPPMLALLDFNKPFTLECDAFGQGLVVVLMQDQRPIAFHSQALKGRSLSLSTYEKELLALVTAVSQLGNGGLIYGANLSTLRLTNKV